MAFGTTDVAEGTGGDTIPVATDSVGGAVFGRTKEANPNEGQSGAYGIDSDPVRVRNRRRGTSDYDSGRVAVGDTLAEVTASTIYPESLLLTNLTDTEQWFTLANAAGDVYVSRYPLAPRMTVPIPFPPTSLVGVHMQASAAASVIAVLAGAQ